VAGGLNSGTYSLYSVSENGMLIYQPGPGLSEAQLVWFDRQGKELKSAGVAIDGSDVRGSGVRLGFALSPDEKRLVLSRRANSLQSRDLWIYDLERGAAVRFTFHASFNSDPVWSPDGERVAFASNRGGIYQKASNGTGEDELLLKTRTRNFL